MIRLIRHGFSLIFILLFATCRKYEEGGLENRTCINLFGGNKLQSIKEWKLVKYEVNGFDSTNQLPHYSENFYNISFILVDEKYVNFYAESIFRKYFGSISDDNIIIGNFTYYPSLSDSVQCSVINGSYLCYWDVYMPDLICTKNHKWVIKKLTKNEFVIEKQSNQNYRITLQSKWENQ